jgi:hypothetical protein
MNETEGGNAKAIASGFKQLFEELRHMRWLEESQQFANLHLRLCKLLTDVDEQYLPDDRATVFVAARDRICGLITRPGVRRLQKDWELWEDAKEAGDVLRAYTKGIERNEDIMCALLRACLGENSRINQFSEQELFFAGMLLDREALAQVKRVVGIRYVKDLKIMTVTKRGLIFTEAVSKLRKWPAITSGLDRNPLSKEITVMGNVYKADVSGIGNILNMAEFMTGVTNTVNQNVHQSAAADEVKALVKALASQVTSVAPKVDVANAEQLGKNLEALSKELSAAKPQRKWYEVSLDGLKEAAEAIGELGIPIVQTVAKLTSLLLT